MFCRVLVVFVFTLCLGPRLNVKFKPGSVESRPLCTRAQQTEVEKRLYNTLLTIYSHFKYHCTKLEHMVVMIIWTIDARQRQLYLASAIYIISAGFI